jgi:hypothetical protein
MNKANSHPMRDHDSSLLCNMSQPIDSTIVISDGMLWEMILDGVLEKLP